MARNRAQSAPATQYLAPAPQSSTWVQTVSGVAVLTVGLQGTATSAVEAPLKPLAEPIDQLAVDVSVLADDPINSVAPVKPTAASPRFSKFRRQVQDLIKKDVQPSAVSQSIARLENHRRELHRHSNEVESQLLGLQQLLSMQSYGTSFADRLLDEDDLYQTKLQQLQTLESDIHIAIEQADTATLNQLKNRLQRADQDLRQIAQHKLQQYIQQAQGQSTLGLWQEPMYQQSLRWLMEHTHERHLLNARQQTLARTLIAVAPD